MATPRTTVDPTGISRLYLQKNQVIPFLNSLLNYCDGSRKKAHRKYLTILAIFSVFSLAFMAGVMDMFDWWDEDEGILVFMAGIGVIVILIVILVMYANAFGNIKRLKARGELLVQFFSLIMADIHPDSGVKGYIDNVKEDADSKYNKCYKTKTSPYSGAEKRYLKHTWSRLKLGLRDGSTLKVKCVDKVKTKSGGIVRFIEIQKSHLEFNTRMYLNSDNKHFVLARQELCQSEEELLEQASLYGKQMAKTCKALFKGLQIRKGPIVAPKSESAAPEKVSATDAAKKLKQMLYNSQLLGLHYEDKQTHFEIEYAPDTTQKKAKIQVFVHQPPREEAYVKLKMAMPQGEPEQLLKANPALAHGRFAYISAKGQPSQVFLIKTLLLAGLDQEELDTAIHGFSQLGSQLQEQAQLPQKLKSHKKGRDPAAEKVLLEKALRGVDADCSETDHKFKLTVRLPEQRQQSVHVRFDRQDAEGNPLIALQTYCGLPDKNKYKMCLEENEALSYGAIGICKLGAQDYFVVTDNQLAHTTDPKELRTAILQVAAKGDRLEKRLSDQDLH